MRILLTLTLILSTLTLSGCGYNTIQTTDENVTATWKEVLNQYQRRNDLIPNLVSVVKGYAAHEKGTLEAITQARARAGSIQATPELLNDPKAMAKFQAAQGELGSALSRLLVISENYPLLKADKSFNDLMSQIEGAENRLAVARNRHIAAINEYNITVRTFPNNLTAMLFGHKTKESLSFENEKAITTVPKVDFGK